MSAFVLPILIAIHVALAIALFVPSLLLPFTQRRRSRRGTTDAPGRVLRGLRWLQAKGSLPLGIGLGLTGLGLIAILGASVLRQPWLLVALGIYAIDLGLAYFVQRPAVKRLAGVAVAGCSTRDNRAVTARSRRQRYLSYLMAGLIGAIGLLMSTKPALW